jgi:hypothetical protein
MKSQEPNAIAMRKSRKALKDRGLVKTVCMTKPEDKDRLKKYVRSTLKGEIGS